MLEPKNFNKEWVQTQTLQGFKATFKFLPNSEAELETVFYQLKPDVRPEAKKKAPKEDKEQGSAESE